MKATEAILARLRKSHGTTRNDCKNVVDIDSLFDCCGRSRALPCQGDLDPFDVSSATEFHVEPNMWLDGTVEARQDPCGIDDCLHWLFITRCCHLDGGFSIDELVTEDPRISTQY